MKSAVKNYTDIDLINRMRSLPSFKYVPDDHHIITVRSKEDIPDSYDDKLYLFKGDKCLDVMSCTTNSGTYGLRNFMKWNRKGTAVIKSNEVYYDVFQKSDGINVRHHNGKMECLRQVGNMKYYRDNNKNNRVEETGRVYTGNYSTNVHANSYTRKKGIVSWAIGKWGTGCIVIPELTMYYDVLLRKIPFYKKITHTLLKEF